MGGFFDALSGKAAKHERHRAERKARAQAEKLEAANREEAMEEAAAKERRLMRQRAGRGSTILTGPQGLGGFGQDRSPKATLLG